MMQVRELSPSEVRFASNNSFKAEPASRASLIQALCVGGRDASNRDSTACMDLR